MSSQTPIDLTDVPVQELFSELQRRYSAVVVITLAREAEGDQIYDTLDSGFSGGKYTAIGLANSFAKGLMDDGQRGGAMLGDYHNDDEDEDD